MPVNSSFCPHDYNCIFNQMPPINMPVFNLSFCPHDYACIFNQMPPINMPVFNSKFLPDDYACIFIEYYSTALEEYFLNLTKRCSWSWSRTARWTGKWRRVSTRRWASRRRPWRTAPRFDFGLGALDMGILDMSHSQMLGKFEYTGGPIFKVVLEC